MFSIDRRTHSVNGPIQADLEMGRLTRLRDAIEAGGCDAGLFYDPINIRYATGTSNMQVYSLHNPCRYVYVPVSGPVVLFEFKGCEHLSNGHPAVDEVRTAISWYHFIAGPRVDEFAKQWAEEISDLLGQDARDLAVDRCDPVGATALAQHGIRLHDGQAPANHARMIKTPQEMDLIRHAIAGCEAGIATMRATMQPGQTEQELWAQLHAANIAAGGEWLETRLLTSGQRTNPWYQECSDKTIDPGDLVAFDTDLIGIGATRWTSHAPGPPTTGHQPPTSNDSSRRPTSNSSAISSCSSRVRHSPKFRHVHISLGPTSTRSPTLQSPTGSGCATSTRSS